MAIVVRHADSAGEYVLLGTGFGVFKAMRGAVLGDILSEEDHGEQAMAALCAADGKILWAHSDQLTVVSVDGEAPHQVLARRES